MRILILLLVLSSQILFSATTKHHSGIFLGKPRLYHAAKSNRALNVIIMRLGERKDKRFLISFDVAGNEMHHKSYVYKEYCQSKACHESTYIQEGGYRRSIMSENLYQKKYLYALLPGERNKIALHYDDKMSQTLSRDMLYDTYRESIYADLSSSAITILLKDSMEHLNKLCHASMDLDIDEKSFTKAHANQLLSRAKPMIDEIAKTCTDSMYREVFMGLKVLRLVFSPQYQKMFLNEKEMLVLYLSSDLYNPSVVAKKAIEQL